MDKYRDNDIVFGIKWFEKHQSKLLWLLNTPIIRVWFRWCLRIKKDDCPTKEKIINIQPSNFSFGEKKILVDWIIFKNGNSEILDLKKRTHKRLYLKSKIQKGFALQKITDFRSHDKYAKRLYFAFKPFWYLLHFFDWAMLDRIEYATQLSFGFSTLTVYPPGGNAGTTCTALGGVSSGASWATQRAVTSAGGNVGNGNNLMIQCEQFGTNANLIRAFFTFNTAPLTNGVTVSAAVLSLYSDSTQKNTGGSVKPNLALVSVAPSVNNDWTSSDFNISNWGSTRYASDLAITTFAASSQYYAMTLNATGIAAVSLTSITKIGLRASSDVDNTAPINDGRGYCYGYFANSNGASPDPKLVVTYTMDPAKVLVVAGGGGGVGNLSGAGGGGGVLYDAAFTLTAQTYAVTVGNGGAVGYNGENSVFSSITAIGGGHGGARDSTTAPATDGGSGGGGGSKSPQANSTLFGSGTSGQGHNGGYGYGISSNYGADSAGGGGGGAGAGAADGAYRNGGNGGIGVANSISGTSVYYGGGGGGGSYYTGGTGGNGGGGNGEGSGAGSAGTPNTGGGGGGGYAGGSGIVIIRFPTVNFAYSSVTGAGNTLTTSGIDSIATFIVSGNLIISNTPSGPTNLKSRSGNLKANIKSTSGNVIANIKNLSGNV